MFKCFPFMIKWEFFFLKFKSGCVWKSSFHNGKEEKVQYFISYFYFYAFRIRGQIKEVTNLWTVRLVATDISDYRFVFHLLQKMLRVGAPVCFGETSIFSRMISRFTQWKNTKNMQVSRASTGCFFGVVVMVDLQIIQGDEWSRCFIINLRQHGNVLIECQMSRELKTKKFACPFKSSFQCHTRQPWDGAISQLIEDSHAWQDLQSRLLFLDFNDNV